MSTTPDAKIITCDNRGCEEPAVAYVRFQAWDDEAPHWHSHEMDLCDEHYDELERENDHVYVAINEVIEYRQGSHWKQAVTA